MKRSTLGGDRIVSNDRKITLTFADCATISRYYVVHLSRCLTFPLLPYSASNGRPDCSRLSRTSVNGEAASR